MKNKTLKISNVIVCVLLLLSLQTTAQTGLSIPKLSFTAIPGAPKLSAPKLIVGTLKPVVGEGHGIAAPAFYDWDGDGLKDLLIGEYGSGIEHGNYVGSFIRVYVNEGTAQNPVYTGRFSYARPGFSFFKEHGNGTPYSTDQSCCMGTSPQFIDLDNDGFMDMISGEYYGAVKWFRGSEEGFRQGIPLEQAGEPIRKDLKNDDYWIYSMTSAGDLTGDGLPDLVFGGRSLRLSKNIGTKANPKFAERVLLQDIEGNSLKVYENFKSKSSLGKPPVAGAFKINPLLVDWDNDGTLDLLVSNYFAHEGLDIVTFFKGKKVNSEHRFQKGIPLFRAENGKKAFPGSGPRIYVTDWNSDGVNDLLIGTSVNETQKKFNDQLSWNWELDFGLPGAGKEPSNALTDGKNDAYIQRYKDSVKLPPGVTMEQYMSIRYKGYIYVMLGVK